MRQIAEFQSKIFFSECDFKRARCLPEHICSQDRLIIAKKINNSGLTQVLDLFYARNEQILKMANEPKGRLSKFWARVKWWCSKKPTMVAHVDEPQEDIEMLKQLAEETQNYRFFNLNVTASNINV